MKNREAYAEEIVAIALAGEPIAINKKTLKPCACITLDYNKCLLSEDEYVCNDDALQAWAESEYTPTFELDELVMVSDYKNGWAPRHYKTYDTGAEKPFVVWAAGTTSMTATYNSDTTHYRFCRKPTDEEIAEIKARNGIKEA